MLPTLEQFLPRCWGQMPSTSEEVREEANTALSLNVATCNAILNGTNSESEEVFTAKEQQVLHADDEQEGNTVNVNTNL